MIPSYCTRKIRQISPSQRGGTPPVLPCYLLPTQPSVRQLCQKRRWRSKGRAGPPGWHHSNPERGPRSTLPPSPPPLPYPNILPIVRSPVDPPRTPPGSSGPISAPRRRPYVYQWRSRTALLGTFWKSDVAVFPPGWPYIFPASPGTHAIFHETQWPSPDSGIWWFQSPSTAPQSIQFPVTCPPPPSVWGQPCPTFNPSPDSTSSIYYNKLYVEIFPIFHIMAWFNVCPNQKLSSLGNNPLFFVPNLKTLDIYYLWYLPS